MFKGEGYKEVIKLYELRGVELLIEWIKLCR